MAMSSPRTSRISFSESLARSRPLKIISPPVTRPGGATSRMIDIAVTLFPHPDSPTRATASPCRTLNETLSTACTAPSAPKNDVRRFLTSRIASRGSTSRSATADPGSPTGCAAVTGGIVARKVSGERPASNRSAQQSRLVVCNLRHEVRWLMIQEDVPGRLVERCLHGSWRHIRSSLSRPNELLCQVDRESPLVERYSRLSDGLRQTAWAIFPVTQTSHTATAECDSLLRQRTSDFTISKVRLLVRRGPYMDS